jgi:hypothetical protein
MLYVNWKTGINKGTKVNSFGEDDGYFCYNTTVKRQPPKKISFSIRGNVSLLKFHAFLISALARDERLASLSDRLTSGERRGWLGHRVGLNKVAKRKTSGPAGDRIPLV